ncbi:hypothetical protein GCM10025870_23820 [Agromyces marinus]|uniref:Low temperature requirement A protein (LtrA) n=1 Tax=Agromyces marinus TaxID=1389020 RepID=A0ABN6YD78_9MICO|nr:hypothetical protein [Agromyces marinus]BDZ55309.1 hypothetical protein GCM10025870_23820 [Agromyces marinus]
MVPDQVRGVHATWVYTLGSIVFLVLFLDAITMLSVAERVAATGDRMLVVLVVSMLAAMVVQVRYCWFLRVGRGGGLPAARWTVALLATGGLAWVVGLFAEGAALSGAILLWVAACLIAPLLTGTARWGILAGVRPSRSPTWRSPHPDARRSKPSGRAGGHSCSTRSCCRS